VFLRFINLRNSLKLFVVWLAQSSIKTPWQTQTILVDIPVNKLLTFLAGAVFIALGTAQVAQAAVLGTEDFTLSGGTDDIFTEFKPTLAIAPALPELRSSAPATTAPLFVGTSITPADVGRTFTATEANDSNFNNFVALLTNGKLNKVTLAFGAGTLGNSELSLTKVGDSFGQNTNLFVSTIDSISLQINSLTLNTPGTDLNGNGVWTDYSFTGTAVIDGEPVPEPISVISTLAFGIGVIVFGRKQQLKPRKVYPL